MDHFLKRSYTAFHALILLFTHVIFSFTPTASSAETSSGAKYALVIGNGAYKTGPLNNPPHDARLMGETLKGLGFELIGGDVRVDLGREELAQSILEFGDKLHSSRGVGVFYYAGHGVQVRGKSYLIPVDAKMERAEHMEIYAVPIEQVLTQMEGAENKLNLMILDACRNNPFPSSSRSLTRGVKLGAAPSGTLILYSTRPGMVAQDGEGENSPFTQALTDNMKKPGLRIEDVMRSTIKEVERETSQRQTPWQEGFVREEFYFIKPDLSGHQCPAGSTYNGSECVISEAVCPAGSSMQDGRCIAQVLCPAGTERVEGRGCVSKLTAHNSVSNLAPSYGSTQHQTKRYEPQGQGSSILSHIPSWSYLSLSLGLVAHGVNFFSANPMMINSSFLIAVTGYALSAGGVGYGIYEGLTEGDQPRSQDRFAERALDRFGVQERLVRFNFSF